MFLKPKYWRYLTALMLGTCPPTFAAELRIDSFRPLSNGRLELQFQATAANYYRVLSGPRLNSTTNPVAVVLQGPVTLPRGRNQGFFVLQQLDRSASLDTDGDGVSDIAELQASPPTDPLANDALETATGSYLGSMSGFVVAAPDDKTTQVRIRVTQLTRQARVHYSSLKNVLGDETPLANNLTIKAALVPADSTGNAPNYAALIPLSFGGQPAGTLAPTQVLSSDPLSTELQPGYYWLRTYHSNGGAGEYVRNRVFVPRQWNFHEGIVDGDVAQATSPIEAESQNGLLYTAFALTGTVPAGSHRGVLLVGGSNMGDYFDAGAPGDVGQGGWAPRALDEEYGLVRIAQDRESIRSFAQASRRTLRMPAAAWCTSAIVAFGANDSGEQTADIKAGLTAITSALRDAGITRVAVASLLPRSNSSDGWVSLTNQVVIGWQSFSAVNTWLSTNGSGANAYIDTATRVGDGNGRWRTGTVIRQYQVGAGSTANAIAGAGFGTQAQTGRILRVISGPAAGEARTIMWNNTTTLGLFNGFSITPGTGDTFQMIDGYTFDGVQLTTRGMIAAASAVDPTLFP